MSELSRFYGRIKSLSERLTKDRTEVLIYGGRRLFGFLLLQPGNLESNLHRLLGA